MWIVIISQYDACEGRKYNNYVGPFASAALAAKWRDSRDLQSDPNYVANRIVHLIEP